MEIEENLNVAAFTVLENSVAANSKPFYLLCKRMTDFILALVGLILLSPVFLIVALLIKWDDPKGTVFFCQDRVGKDPVTWQDRIRTISITGVFDASDSAKPYASWPSTW